MRSPKAHTHRRRSARAALRAPTHPWWCRHGGSGDKASSRGRGDLSLGRRRRAACRLIVCASMLEVVGRRGGGQHWRRGGGALEEEGVEGGRVVVVLQSPAPSSLLWHRYACMAPLLPPLAGCRPCEAAGWRQGGEGAKHDTLLRGRAYIQHISWEAIALHCPALCAADAPCTHCVTQPAVKL